MHVVIVDGDVSYPPTSGKRLRTLNLMLRLAGRHRIAYIARTGTPRNDLDQAAKFLQEHGIEPILLEDPVPRKAGPLFYLRLAGNLLSSLPYSVVSHQSQRMRRALGDYAARHKVDLWQFEWSPYLDLLDASVPEPRLLVAHNVDTLIWQRYGEQEPSWLRRLYIAQQRRKFARFERRAFQRARRVVAVSAEDAHIIRTQFGQPQVDVVDNGIDRAYFDQASGERDSQRILFLGALDWRPNLDGVGVLLERIFPALRAKEPAARLVIVGRHPPTALVERVKNLPGVELHADVPDVRPYLAGCAVMAVPLRIGGGSRLKILEALACGMPVVSTMVGAEGLSLVPGQHYVQAEEGQMADALLHILRQPSEARGMAEAGRVLVRQTYDWGVLAGKLEASWAKCREGTA